VSDVPAPLADALHDRYALERELGRGGMATVYLATDLRHRRRVALKVLDPAVGALLGRERFLREIETAAQLQHPHILPVHDSGEAAGLLWYTMPFVEGESLRDRLRRDTSVTVGEAVRLGREIAGALDHAHRKGVIHRDIKPENILLSDGQALVADFGIAHRSAAAGETLTQTGLSLGTPAYMSPEQALGDRTVDGRSDQYALGCLMFELVAGRPPYTGTTAQAVVSKHLTESVPALSTIRPEVPVGVSAAVQRAMAKAPDERFPTSGAFAEALAAGLEPGRAQERNASRSRRRTVVVLAIAGTAAVAVGYFASRAPGARSPPTGPGGAPLVAVMPLETIGTDTSQRYFTAGMTEEIAGQLSRLGGLRVVGTGVAQAYTGMPDGLPRMARELGVGSVVGGTVRRAGDQVRIAVRLADARSGQTLWSDQYDRPLANVLEVQSDVARQVATALQARLSPEEAERLGHAASVDPEAHDLVLRSMWMNFADRNETQAGMALLRRALARDSTYAEAWASLARRYFFLAVYGDAAYFDSATAMARTAIAAEPDHADAYATIGDVQSQQGRLAEAEASYAKALALNPSNTTALADLSYLKIILGRHDQGLRLAARAAPLGGNDPVMYYHVGAALLRLERDSVTERWVRAGTRRSNPSFFRLEVQLSELDFLNGRDDQARTRADRLLAGDPGNEEIGAWRTELATLLGDADAERRAAAFAASNPTARSGWLLPESFGAMLGLAWHRQGERRRADSAWNAALDADQHDLAQGHDNPDRYLQTAAIHAIRGESAAALDWLNRGYAAGWNDGRALLRDPFFAPLRENPTFRAVLDRMHADIARQADSVRAISDSLDRISRPGGS
jgi:eukaryotic-like serine/threonine-protein kinase